MSHKTEQREKLLSKNLINTISFKCQKTNKKAFSLLELLVVILILGILAAAVVPQVVGAGDKAKVDLTCVNMSTAGRTLEMFKLDNGVFPETEEGFDALMSNPDMDKYPNYSSNAYLKEYPKDAWRGKMIYIKKGNDFDIVSYGADRKEGGEDYSADLKLSGCKK